MQKCISLGILQLGVKNKYRQSFVAKSELEKTMIKMTKMACPIQSEKPNYVWKNLTGIYLTAYGLHFATKD